MPGRLEGEHASTPGAAEGCRHGAREQFLESHPRVRNPEPGQPLTSSGQHDDLVLSACQVQADDHIITPEAASIVRHVGPSFVPGQTREGITRTGRRCRLPLSHTLILDNGPEFVATAILRWLSTAQIETALIDPGKPWQNATDESFNGKFRDEYLSLQWFRNRIEAKVGIDQWRRQYNEVRPHSSLGYRTPAEFKASCLTQGPRDAVLP